MKVYQISKTLNGRKFWTGTIEMTPERYAEHTKENADYIYTLIKPDCPVDDTCPLNMDFVKGRKKS